MEKRSLALLFLLNSFLVMAQNAGQLSGRILDQQTQLPIQGVTVLLEGTTMGVASEEEGYFTFRDVPTRTYNVVISHLGYQSQTVYNIIVKTFGTPPLQILLEESSNELDEIVVFQSPLALFWITRNVRKDANNEIKKTDTSEDLQKNAEIDIQELTDQYITKVDEILNVKEKEILTV